MDDNSRGPSIVAREGTTPTVIEGLGAFVIDQWTVATIVGAEGARISGLKIGAATTTLGHMSVVMDSVMTVVSDNTFQSPTYGGIFMHYSTSSVKDNVFDGSSYGVYIKNCPDAPVIEENSFLSTSIPIDVVGSVTTAVVRNNTITGSGQVGIQVQAGQPRIEGNVFDKSTGYSFGAVRSQSTSAMPIVRGNTFLCTNAALNVNGTPDFGTGSDPGNNDFSGVTGVSFTHEGSSTIQALGNTWPNTPPVVGNDIVITGGGSVVF